MYGMHVPTFLLFLKNSDNAHTTSSELFDAVLEPILLILGLVAGVEFNYKTGHTLDDALKLARRCSP